MEDKTECLTKTHIYNPFEEAGIFSKLFYIYMLPIFRDGLKKDLSQSDILPPLKAHRAQSLGGKLEDSWNHEVTIKKNPSLWMVLWKVYWKDIVYTGFLWFFLETLIKLLQPFCLSKFLEFYRSDSSTATNEVYFSAFAIAVTQLMQVLMNHYYLLNLLQVALKIRVAICSLIYRKALKLNKTSFKQTTIGQMVNLLSNDASRLDSSVVRIHYLWFCPIQAIIVTTLCYIHLGLAALTGVILLVLFVPFQMWMAKQMSVFRQKSVLKTDERIRIMSEIIYGIQVIKLYTWEKPFEKLVEISRRKELNQIRNIGFIRAVIGSLNLFLSNCAVYLSLIVFVLTGNIPTAQYVYTLTIFYNLLKYAITIYFPQGITQIAELTVSMKRFREFLLLEEVDFIAEFSNSTDEVRIVLCKTSAKWDRNQTECTLQNINIEIHGNETVALVGPVGSGKTTILNLILRELTTEHGSIDVRGTISYASQEPWIFAGTIRENILFGHKLIYKRYNDVLRVCALDQDISNFPFGDQTEVGERGVSLSGGQKARINLARAVYKEADIYLLDDPLSAVDVQVGKQIFEECIKEYLKNKLVVLVTHQFQYLNAIERIYFLENGQVQTSGNYEDLLKFNKEFTTLLRDYDKEVVVDNTETINTNITLKNNPKIPANKEETRNTGKISWNVYKSYIFSGGSNFHIAMLFSGFVLSQTAASLTDYFQSIWVNFQYVNDVTSDTNLDANPVSLNRFLWFSNIFIKDNALYIYTLLIGFTVILTLGRSFGFYQFTTKASFGLHKKMLGKILHAPMKFFQSNPSGRILNRFSSDIGSIDEQLPLIILDTLQIVFLVSAAMMLITIINPWMLLPTTVMFGIFYILRLIYLSTSRDVTRLQGTTKSPIYSHLTTSLQGLTTIRTFRAQKTLEEKFDDYQNINSSAWFTSVGCARCFGLWLDLHCVLYVTLVILSILFSDTSIFGGHVGLAITQALTLTGMFQWGMRQWSELENRMVNVERVKEYGDLAPEIDKAKNNISEEWPQKGDIQFKDVWLKYDDDGNYVLKKLNFSIKHGEKIGIVGRTGAGKSSIVAALFRLADAISGEIIIDEIDTQTVSLNNLRSKISIIPQEPVLFAGSIRQNLDPFDSYKDETLWRALDQVQLKVTVTHLKQGLETQIVEGGRNFSVGQRQLICLARAILRNNKILLLDEATANIDLKTDALIQDTIRKKFADCTVITIAHRLHTVIDSDQVLVMEMGEIVEFGPPHELMEKKGVFYQFLEQSGRGLMEKLAVNLKK
ncbi:hypothetical protein ABEB36_002732 [Hypothenemus hampei]|uniref:Uncharacterized protein n=1 Tax=Hypothenemus hampei TaxID=57062 RepID=A0ABD1F6X0_HYPHA